MGENGSGKSTLVKILSGVHRPDSGQVMIAQSPLRASYLPGGRPPVPPEGLPDGKAVYLAGTPRAAVGAGVATVFQEVQSVPGQSVLDNLWLGTDGILRRARPGGAGRGDRRD